MHIPSVSREWMLVPAALLAATPADLVDLALVPDNDDGAEPAAGDWIGSTWLRQGGVLVGAGLLIGPGGGRIIAAGAWRVWVREHVPGETLPVWPWSRLSVGVSP